MTLKPPSENTPIGDGRLFFFVQSDYGARGDGVTDDTAAIQSAITAACAVDGTVVFEPTSAGYRITNTLNIAPATGAQVGITLRGFGNKWYEIVWDGGNNKSVFHSYGWKRGGVYNVYVKLTAVSGVTVWDVDDEPVTYASSGGIQFSEAKISMNASGPTYCTSCVGWRMGHHGGGDVSVIGWDTCTISADGDAATNLNIGWVYEHANCLGYTFVNCGSSGLNKSWTNTPTSGSAGSGGGGGHTFIGPVCTSNAIDWEVGAGHGPLAILGGRMETGKCLVKSVGGNKTPSNVVFTGLECAGYNPSDGRIFNFDSSPIQLTLEDCEFLSGAGNVPFVADFITGGADASLGFGSVRMSNCIVYAAAGQSLFTLTGPWDTTITGGAIVGSDGQALGRIPTPTGAVRVNVLPIWVYKTFRNPTGTLPADSIIHSCKVYVEEAFNSGGDEIHVGLVADGVTIADNVDATATGMSYPTPGADVKRYAAAQTIQVTHYRAVGVDPTTGKALVLIEYSAPPTAPF